MSNFAMGTILGKGFAQAQVLLCTSACAKPFPKIIAPMAKLDIAYWIQQTDRPPMIKVI